LNSLLVSEFGPRDDSATGRPLDESNAAGLLRSLEEIDLDRYTIVGRYARFDPRLRAALDELRQRLVGALGARGGRPQNFLVWGPPGSGKSYLIQQIAASLPGGVGFVELNLSQLEESRFRSSLQSAWEAPGSLLCFVDEADALAGASWPYELLLSYLEPVTPRTAPTAFVLAGSGGRSSAEMRRTMEARPKGPDLLSRIPTTNSYEVNPLGVGDRILVSTVQLLEAASAEGIHLRDVEKLALLYVAEHPAYGSARQLRLLADQSAQRIPRGESRLRYDHLFRPGDPENKEFWSRARASAGELVGAYVRVRAAPAATTGRSRAPVPPAVTGSPSVPTEGVPRIAVLPFRNISPDPADAYLADGLTDEIISTLGRISGVEVVSRTSVMRFRGGSDKSAAQIGQELNAGSLLDGSVRKAGSRLRITAEFVDTRADRHIWGETFDGEISDVFGMQKEIATRVAQALRGRWGGTSVPASRPRPAPPIEAYLLYLKGRAAGREATREGMERAIGLYQQALDRDPGYADALAAIAGSYRRIGFWEMAPSREVLVKAKSFAERALAIDPEHAEARLDLARLLVAIDWDFTSAEREVRQVVALRPQAAEPHAALANLVSDRPEEAAREAHLAVQLEPLSPTVVGLAGIALLYARKYPEAVATLRVAHELDAPDISALHNLGLALVQNGNVSEGLAAMEEAYRRTALPSPIQPMELAYGHLRAGDLEKAVAGLHEIVQRAQTNPAWWGAAAGVYASLGRPDEAITALETAMAHRVSYIGSHMRDDFIFDPLRSDPRFQKLLLQLG
jgi:TolB-like protein/Tfp pilus assembly protein PilF